MRGKFATLLNTALADKGHLVPNQDNDCVDLLVVFQENDEEREPTQEELSAVGFKKCRLEAHPEGSDRGGYVPTAYSVEGQTAYYDENGGGWV